MSADEIKALAQQAFVDALANHHAGLLKTEARLKQYADALLDYAAMVERCEAEIALTDKTHYTYKRLNYILRGDAGKEER